MNDPTKQPIHLRSQFNTRAFYCGVTSNPHGVMVGNAVVSQRSTDDLKRVTCSACLARLDGVRS